MIADLIGVEGADDVGMIKPAKQPHLPMKPGDRARPGCNMRRDDLESDEAAHELVLGLEHPAFGPLAQAIKDNVAADDKATVLLRKRREAWNSVKICSATRRAARAEESRGYRPS